jgi:hypothetical protein
LQRGIGGVLDSLRYDLKLIEWGFGGLIAIVGGWLVVVAIVCWRRTGGAGSDPSTDIPNAGARARNGAVRALQFGAVGYVVLVGGLTVLAAMKQHLGPTPSVLAIYVLSAFRVVLYLFLMVGPLSVVTGIIVDVLFYVADAEPLRTAPTLRDRFAAALACASANSRPVAVAAHSQGSVNCGRRNRPTARRDAAVLPFHRRIADRITLRSSSRQHARGSRQDVSYAERFCIAGRLGQLLSYRRLHRRR